MADMAGKRVCVIGAGPSGCSVLRAFSSAQSKGEKIPEVVCFENQAVPSGLWNFTWRTGLDGKGEAVHGSQYRHLWSNGPKECLEFADYTFMEHFGVPIPSYPPREVLIEYINGRLDKAGVRKWIRFQTPVRDVQFDDSTKKFTVKVHSHVDNTDSEELFDYVLCCSGHFSTPNVPEFAGMETFTGRIMHSHDYRNAEEMAGLNVLIIGTSYSAEDIASQCYKFGAKSLTLSWRTAPMGFHWPDNFKTVPLLQSLSGRTCTFKDGQTAEIDVIIQCTGYQHYFPFIGQDLRLTTPNRLWIDTLHEGVVLPSNDRMFYIGMQDQWLTFNMFDAQAWYARDVILGRIALPSRETMQVDWKKWREAEDGMDGTDEACIRYQCNYTKRLIDMTDYPKFDLEKVVQTFMDWEHNKHENIMTFRDHSHKSVMDGTVAPVHHTPWLTAFDDSVPCFVQDNQSKKAGY